jgi:hypothetical protein
VTHLPPFAFISAVVVALCWRFSLYVLTLYPRSSLARSIGVAIALLGIMGMGEVMVMTATTVKPFVLGWRVVSVAGSLLPVLWLQFNVFLLPEDRVTWPTRLVRLGWPLGTAFALLGTFANSPFDYTSLAPLSDSWKTFRLLPGPLALLWHAYLVVYTGLVICLSPHLFRAHENLSDPPKTAIAASPMPGCFCLCRYGLLCSRRSCIVEVRVRTTCMGCPNILRCWRRVVGCGCATPFLLLVAVWLVPRLTAWWRPWAWRSSTAACCSWFRDLRTPRRWRSFSWWLSSSPPTSCV